MILAYILILYTNLMNNRQLGLGVIIMITLGMTALATFAPMLVQASVKTASEKKAPIATSGDSVYITCVHCVVD
jgi:hypothetical protein